MNQKKLCALVEYLMNQEMPVTAKELAKFLNVSVRTVKSYVSGINQLEKEILIKSGRMGYSLERKDAERYLNCYRETKQDIPQTYEERSRYINQKFLKYHTNKLDYYVLAEELNFSVETIRNDIYKMNSSFENYNISYKMQGNDVYLIAEEKNLRRLAQLIWFADTHGQMLDYAKIKDFFGELNVNNIRQIIEMALNRHELYVNDFGMLSVLLHICIIIRRLKNNKYLGIGSEVSMKVEPQIYQATEEICKNLSVTCLVQFTEEEIYNVYLLIYSNANIVLDRKLDSFYDYIGDELLRFVKYMICEMNNKYYVEMNNEDFLYPFAMHIKNLISRASLGKHTINPMREIIQYSHPIIFDMAVFCACLVREKYKIQIDENELSYLALHIGGELERQKLSHEKIRTVLLCPDYLGYASKIYNQILMNFGDEIELLACIKDISEVGRYRCQMVLTTVEVKLSENLYKVVMIPFFESRQANYEIENAIDALKEERKLLILKKYFGNIFSKEIFFYSEDNNLTPEYVMKTLANRMVEKGVVLDNYYECLLERERGASTGFPNIAIPHSIHMDAIKTTVGVFICPKGIEWGSNSVKIVLAVAINKNDAFAFSELYQALIKLFDNEKNLKQIIGKKTFDDFTEAVEQFM